MAKRSPFPGMDPYIEAQESWPHFHESLIGDLCRAISASLPDGYRCRINERSYVVLAGIDEKDISAALPDGLKTIDAEVAVRDCGAQGIPTV